LFQRDPVKVDMADRKKRWFCISIVALICTVPHPFQCLGQNGTGTTKSGTTAGRESRIYFVDPEGSDELDGLSPQTAWKTLKKVNGTQFIPGDTIKLRCGGTWQETLNIPSSGTLAKPIVFSSYGDGPRPVLDASDSLPRSVGNDPRTDWVPTGVRGEYFTRAYFWTNQMFRDNQRVNEGKEGTLKENEFAFSSPAGKVVYRPPKGGNLFSAAINAARLKAGIICRKRSNVVVENLETRYSLGNSAHVAIADSDHVKIRNCVVHGTRGFGIGLESAHDVTIEECEVYDAGVTGIGTTGNGTPSHDVIVRNNRIHNVGWLAMDRFNDGHGIGVGNLVGCHHWLIEGNDISECGRGGGESYGDGGCGPAVTMWETSNIIIRNNRIHDNYRGGITLELGGQSPARDMEVSFNLVHHNGRNRSGLLPWGVGWSGIGVYKFQSGFEVDGLRILNNVITDNYIGFPGASASALYLTVAGDREMTGVEVRNNIVANNGTTNYEYWKRTPKVRAKLENNLFFRTGSRRYVKVDDTTYDQTVGEKFRKDTGCPDCLLEDPVFVDPVNRDYRLTSRSRFREKKTPPKGNAPFGPSP
jgi:hypothetical protein